MIMKRSIIILVLLLACAAAADARSYITDRLHAPSNPWRRSTLAGNSYHNLALTWQKLDLIGTNTLTFAPQMRGLAITSGHSFMIHERPLWKIFHIGFDVTWIDAEGARWRRTIAKEHKWIQKLDLGIGAGPALHISPGGRFGMHLYARYMPTYSLLMHNFAGAEDGTFEVAQGLSRYFTSGFAISWDTFSVGAEYRHGTGRYRGVKIPDISLDGGQIALIDNLLSLNLNDALDRQRINVHGLRVYLSFRF